MQHGVCRAAGRCPCTDRGLAGTQQLLGPCHKGTGREKGSLVPAKEWAEQAGKGGEQAGLQP